ncbi:flagellar basal body-associated FliL family protein [Hippea jasoniae]|uniref:flagellar basal body-associated FliL family protein n=1 Tax=Hippea jasoniae TaxID=944479 RepID=UPI00054EB71C|nr:flagellar basal body-associated FliL family protein [Hippea jasoniae]
MAKEKEEAKENEGGKKKSKGKLLIIIVAVVVLIVAGVAVKMFVLGGKKTEEAKPKEKQVEHQKQEEPPPQPQPEYGGGEYVNEANLTPVVVGPLIVNLADVGGDRYLKIKLVLLEAVAKKEEKKEEGEENKTGINLQDAVIKDTIITVLSSKTSDDLLSISGKEELKNELMTAINRALHRPVVRKIYFLTFIIQ